MKKQTHARSFENIQALTGNSFLTFYAPRRKKLLPRRKSKIYFLKSDFFNARKKSVLDNSAN